MLRSRQNIFGKGIKLSAFLFLNFTTSPPHQLACNDIDSLVGYGRELKLDFIEPTASPTACVCPVLDMHVGGIACELLHATEHHGH